MRVPTPSLNRIERLFRSRGAIAIALFAACSAQGDNRSGEAPSVDAHALEQAGGGVASKVPVSALPQGPGDLAPAKEVSKLIAPNIQSQNNFGFAIAVDGATVAVGAPFEDNAVANEGSVYVFTKNGNSWALEAELTASDAAPSDGFGKSVAVSGDTIVAGAQGDDNANGQNAGAAYVFTRNAGVWTEQAKLIGSTLDGGDIAGYSVALEGDTAVVGASQGGPASQGAAYVFVRSGGVWSEQAVLLPSDGVVSDSFGGWVAISGDTVIACAPDHDAAGNLAGAAYVFVQSGGVWSQQAKLQPANAAPLDAFGRAASVNGDTAIVGASRDFLGASKGGSAYIFVRSGGAWTQQAELIPSDSKEDDIFGFAADVEGDLALVGAPGKYFNAGRAYTFRRNGSVWTEQGPLYASDAESHDFFGSSVAQSGETLVAGAWGQVHNGMFDEGAAYVYDLQVQGEPCSGGAICDTGLCSDGICCDTACGGDDPGDCQACNIAASLGTCSPAAAGSICRASAAACDTAEGCTGVDLACPPDLFAPDGSACDDNDVCTSADTCAGGACMAGPPVSCDDGNVCTMDECLPQLGCANYATSGPCDDGDPCTMNGICALGSCESEPVLCAGDECTSAGACDPGTGQCKNPPVPDGTPCSIGMCQGGVCTPGGMGGAGGEGGGSSSSSSGTGGEQGSGGDSSSAGSGSGGSAPNDEGGCGCRQAPGAHSEGAGGLSTLAAIALIGLSGRRLRRKAAL